MTSSLHTRALGPRDSDQLLGLPAPGARRARLLADAQGQFCPVLRGQTIVRAHLATRQYDHAEEVHLAIRHPGYHGTSGVPILPVDQLLPEPPQIHQVPQRRAVAG